MDPDESWRSLICARYEGNRAEIQVAASDLLGWLNRGGFPPTITSAPPLTAAAQRLIVRDVCETLLARYSKRKEHLG